MNTVTWVCIYVGDDDDDALYIIIIMLIVSTLRVNSS